VFLSYRREDSSPWAGRLRDSLASRVGDHSIFHDVSAVRAGENFTEAIDRALSKSDVALIVIGPRWLMATDAAGVVRLTQPSDYVRTELASALSRDLRVVPVLVGGASMPDASDMPEELAALALRQAVTLHDETWHEDVEGLWQALRGERRPHRSRWSIGAGLVVLALVVALIVAWRDDTPDGDGSDDGLSHLGDLDNCPEGPGGWTPITPPSDTSGAVATEEEAWSLVVEDVYKWSEPDGWNVFVDLTATNDADAVAGPNPDHYLLVLDEVQFPATCADLLAGIDPLEPGAANQIRLGFDLPRDPADGQLALDIKIGDQRDRIDLS
jgi:hypothetical protein